MSRGRFATSAVGLVVFVSSCAKLPTQREGSFSAVSQAPGSHSPVKPPEEEEKSSDKDGELPREEVDESDAVAPPQPPSPFRRVISASGGSLFEHDQELLYVGERVLLSLATGATLARCDEIRGMLMSGKSLYLAARLSPYSACPDEPFLLEHVGKKWELRRFIDAHDLHIERWVANTTIAAVVPYRLGPPFGYELVRVAGGANPPRPMRGPSHPTEPERKCYTELQEPRSLHSFPSGALMVLGAYRCDLPMSEDEAISTEEEKERGRPAIESFAKGSYKSQIFSLPIDEIVSSIEGDSENLFILGKIKESWEEHAPYRLALLSFDGAAVTEIPLDLGDVERLVAGPFGEGNVARADAPQASIEEDLVRAAARQLWFSGARAMWPASGVGEPLWFPEGCEAPYTRFWRGHAWLQCDDGVYTTDLERTPIEMREDGDKVGCDGLDPRPEFAVRGIYQKPSTAGGCGQRRPLSGLPQPKGTPSKLRLDF